MRPSLDGLEAHLASMSADGYLIDAGSDTADQRYLAGYFSADPFTSLYADGSLSLLFWGTDYFTAKEESHADRVYRASDFGYQGYGSLTEQHRVLGEFVNAHDVDTVAVPERFPLGSAAALEEAGIEVVRDAESYLSSLRRRKSAAEVDAIRDSIGAAEAGFETVEGLLTRAEERDGVLELDGEPLTADRIRRDVKWTVLDHGCDLPVSVVASGADTADPHGQSSGPVAPDDPVLVDLGPVDQDTGYYADMTRTFVRGEPPAKLAEWYDLVRDALEEAIEVIGPGVSGTAVNDRLCSYFEDRGFATPRTDPEIERGVLHYMGHGIGLDVHEGPLCVPDGDEIEAGNMLAIEPALYDPELGGVRLEDDVLVTETGCENLSNYPKSFNVSE